MANITENRVEIIGYLGQAPEMRSTKQGGKLMSLSIATTESWKDRATGEWKERTDWHRVVVWSEGAIRAFERDGVDKGELVRIVGKLETRKWQDKDGHDRWSTEIVVTGAGDCQAIRTKASPTKPRAATGEEAA